MDWPPPVKPTTTLCVRCRLPRPVVYVLVADAGGERTLYLCSTCLEDLEHLGWTRTELT